MYLIRYLWLLLCYAQYTSMDELQEYEDLANVVLFPNYPNSPLPLSLGVDDYSGCLCRKNFITRRVICFGSYQCKKFPKVKVKSEILRVRTTAIRAIHREDIDPLFYLKKLEIEANYQLTYLEPGLFKNLSNLQQLSLSYNTYLKNIDERLFEGLINLRNLTLVGNGFFDIMKLIPAFKPSILPNLHGLDLSENDLGSIPENAFEPMSKTSLKRFAIRLSRLNYIHPNSLLPLKKLQSLHIGDNDLNATMIGLFLSKMYSEGINLTCLDLSGMGFRRQIPKNLLEIISQTTIKKLSLARNQFEIITDNDFPLMINLEIIDMRNVMAIEIGPYVFEPAKFPNLKVLLLGGNHLPGLHTNHLSNQLLILDISSNTGNTDTQTYYYEVDKDTFLGSKKLKLLNLGYNNIRAIFNYSFRGLENLRVMNLENGTLFYIGAGTFKPTIHLEMLNLGNNPLVASQNLTGNQFEGLNELKVLSLQNCGIKTFYDEDNIFEMMPNLTHLTLRNNKLYYITPETLKPMKSLEYLDLSVNFLISWWQPLFLASGVKPKYLYLTNNKITYFSFSMILDINYLLENASSEIDLTNNVFMCECSTMYKTYMWLDQYGSKDLKYYFAKSNFLCSSPELWEDKKITDFVKTMKTNLHCMVDKVSSLIILSWSAPTLITIMVIALLAFFAFKYRLYIKYWIFLAKLAIGRKFIRNPAPNLNIGERPLYKYDAFVSYSTENRDFIIDLVKSLEETPPYLKMCIYERDFEIGSFISESVVLCMNESRYIILVISNGFAKSQWCRWETQIADYHRLVLDDGTNYDPLILVKVGEIENKYMTATLKYLLKTKIYLTWDEENPDTFWKKLRRVLDRKQ